MSLKRTGPDLPLDIELAFRRMRGVLNEVLESVPLGPATAHRVMNAMVEADEALPLPSVEADEKPA